MKIPQEQPGGSVNPYEVHGVISSHRENIRLFFDYLNDVDTRLKKIRQDIDDAPKVRAFMEGLEATWKRIQDFSLDTIEGEGFSVNERILASRQEADQGIQEVRNKLRELDQEVAGLKKSEQSWLETRQLIITKIQEAEDAIAELKNIMEAAAKRLPQD